MAYTMDVHTSNTSVADGYVDVHTACNQLEDGVQYILPYGSSDDNYDLLPVVCNDGNTILDPSLSFERYRQYFSSLYMYDEGIAGPELDDFSSWREWWLPLESSEQFIYGVSDDCSSSCLTDAAFDKGYYMTGNFYLCAWITKGDCDMDAETYTCYQCARNGGRSSSVYPGVCSHIAMSVDHTVHDDHFECTGNNDNLKPAIGLEHRFCVCYNPTTDYHEPFTMEEHEYQHQVSQLEEEMNSIKDQETLSDTSGIDDGSNNVIYLSNDDFVYGTYRITSPGIYILTEDIELEFNAPSEAERESDTFSPNNYDSFHWMPRTDGSQDTHYMGASTWNGPYQLGFFTAVTVETSNVVIDLNGFEIGMSRAFYLQQRFFSIFELAAKNFVAGQGPVDFGPYLRAAQNVVIKNGVIGRTSHHGIHGNDAQDVTLEDLKIYHFDVAGIQLNGFDTVTITNCDIGPSSSDIPVTGRYLHARTLLRRFAHLVDHHGDEELMFYGRESATVRDYVDELILQMDMVYHHVIDGVDYENDPDWERASDLFMNPNENGYGDGGVVYGILLNSRGGAVMGFGNAPSKSTRAVLDNVFIHDLAIAPLEKLKFKTNSLGGATRGPVADVFDVMKAADQFDDISTAKYVGTAYSNVQIVLSQFERSWFVLDHTCFDDGIVGWALDGVSFGDFGGFYGGCNTDIQLHINKGVIGLRLDNLVDFNVSNIRIESLINTGGLGVENEICGAYTQGNAHQDPMITAGYTGTEGYGITITQSVEGRISNVSIRDVETHHGTANGIALFKDSSVNFDGVIVDGITAGSRLNVEQLRPEMNYLPNKVPIACSIFDNEYGTEWTLSNGVTATNIQGFLICEGDAMIGECDDTSCAAQFDRTYFDGLRGAVVSASATKMEREEMVSSVWKTLTSRTVHDDSG